MTRIVLLNQNSYRLSIGSIVGVDISSFEEDDYISVSCPNWQESISLSASRFELTSQEDVDFSIGPTDSVLLEDADMNVEGDGMELRFPLSLFPTIDKSDVTGVRFRIVADADTEFKVAAIRCISQDWEYPSIDMDTISERLVFPVSPTGDVNQAPSLTPNQMWQDLKPKDFSVSAEIFTGSQTEEDHLWLYFREKEKSLALMTDFAGYTMDDMNGLIPGIGPAESAEQFYLGVKLRWGDDSSMTVTSTFENDPLYEFSNFVLENDTRYMFIVTAKGERIRLQIVKLDLGRHIPLYDTGFFFDTRIQTGLGRFGWKAQIEDGDSSIDNVRHRSANFGNLLTKKFHSATPVVGAQLVETSTTPSELLVGIGTGPFGGIVTSQADESFKIETTGMMKGAATNDFTITDWGNTTIQFSVRRPAGSLIAYLYGDSGNIIQIPIPEGTPNQWQTVRHRMTERIDQTGRYRLVVVKVASPTTSTWYLKNLSITSRSIKWAARGESDPWSMAGDQWVPFRDTANSNNGGVVFKEAGTKLQVQAELLTSNASIREFRTLPKYAEPGRFVWDQVEPDAPQHDISITADVNDLTVDFAADVNLIPEDPREPISYTWYFGLYGHAVGKVVRKVFPSSGLYTATLRVGYSDGTTQVPVTWTQRLSAA